MKFLPVFLAFLCFVSTLSHAATTDAPAVQLQALDKSTARKTTLDVKIGETVKYGSLFIKAHACRESDPLDKPENAAFLQIWEVPINAEKSEWVFSGWMFSSSPALSAMDHPVYDVWVLKCTGGNQSVTEPNTTVEIDSVIEFDGSFDDLTDDFVDSEAKNIEPFTPNNEASTDTATPDADQAEISIDTILNEAIQDSETIIQE